MRDLLKLTACGSVDDGKSTLLGHLIRECGVFSDQWAEIEAIRKAKGDERPDYSLLLDGLEAEREQRITIDVAYRFFSTGKRSFIVADCPGHREYTRNMAVGASFADLAVILVDAEKGIQPQTLRHHGICRLMGIRDFVFAVNKMDRVGFSEAVFRTIEAELERVARSRELSSCCILPVSATKGDNLVENSPRMSWYTGPALLPYLENVRTFRKTGVGFAMPVQRVGRMPDGGRGYQGTVESGLLTVGQTVSVLPSGESGTVRAILAAGKPARQAEQGQAITAILREELDVSRGCVLCGGLPAVAVRRCRARLLWLGDEPMKPGASYFMRLGTAQVPASVDSAQRLPAPGDERRGDGEKIRKNDFCLCTLSFSSAVVTTPFDRNRTLGSFILIDRLIHETAACGIVSEPLDDRSIVPPKLEIGRTERAQSLAQTPMTLWLTGLPGAGKSSIASRAEAMLQAQGKHTMLLDGDELRSGINRRLGFSPEDREENIRVTAEIARLMNDAGLIVLVALVSPGRESRAMARRIVGDRFFEVYVSTPLEVCIARDTKGHYERAAKGQISSFTGVSAPYEPPSAPDLTLDASRVSVDGCAEQLLDFISEHEG